MLLLLVSNGMLHILEIPSFFPPYGGAFCLEQSKALAEQGHVVRIVACVQLGVTISKWNYLTAITHTEDRVMDGITVFYRQTRGLPKCPHLNMKHWVKTVCQMVDDYVTRYGKPDLIHAHCAKWAGQAAMLAGRKWGVPYVVTEHLSSQLFATEFKGDLKKVWQIPMLKEVYRRADRVIPVSAELVDDLASYFGRDYQWTEVSNTIDTDFFAYQPRKPLEGRSFVFCCLAMFIPLKGYDILLRAFHDFMEKAHAPARLIIAGTYTDSKELAEMVQEQGLDRVTDIRGLVDKQGVRDILYESDCLVLASRSEAQPLVLLEAMSTGIPVISTEVTPRSQRIEGCHIVPTDDARALCEKMEWVCRSDSSFSGNSISEGVRKMVSPEAIGQKLTAVFNELISKR